MLQTLEPFLPASDIEATAAFWRDELAFDVTGQNESWLRVTRDDVAMMFHSGRPPATFEGIFVVRTSDVNALAETVSATPEWGPRETGDNRREVAFRDPNGYVVNFSQNIGSAV